MSGFLLLNWKVLLAVAVISAVVALGTAVLLAGRRPQWTERRRIVAASLATPFLLLGGMLIGIVLAAGSQSEGWGDLVRGTLIAIGSSAALLGLLVSVPVAILVTRALRD